MVSEYLPPCSEVITKVEFCFLFFPCIPGVVNDSLFRRALGNPQRTPHYIFRRRLMLRFFFIILSPCLGKNQNAQPNIKFVQPMRNGYGALIIHIYPRWTPGLHMDACFFGWRQRTQASVCRRAASERHTWCMYEGGFAAAG